MLNAKGIIAVLIIVFSVLTFAEVRATNVARTSCENAKAILAEQQEADNIIPVVEENCNKTSKYFGIF